MKEVDTTRKSSRLQNSRLGKHVNNVSGTELKKCTKKKKSDLGSDSEIEKISKKVNKMPKRSKIDHSHKRGNKKMSNNAINDKKMSSNEEENEDEDEDGDVEDEEDEGKKSRKSSESNDSKFSPAVLGLLRVGDNFPKKEKKEPVLLNRRGMPPRIRKKNRLFFDESVINPLMPKQRSKKDHSAKAKEKNTTAKNKVKIKVEKKEEVDQKPQPTVTDMKAGQKIGMRLRNLLKLPKAHKWVCYEWFYSNIDKVLFQGKNDFMICLQESFPQLKTTSLTRTEWCQIRRLMGKPRRCSQAFFDEERQELERKRTKIRQLQQRKLSDLSSCKDLPDRVPLQLTVGRKVTARLRKPQDGLFTGTVDAVDTSNNTYRITFERPGLGTYSVPDYEVLSNEEPDMFSLSTFNKRFHNQPRYLPSTRSQLIEIKSEAKVDASRSSLGQFPLAFLEMIVTISKILTDKKKMVQKLKELNAEAERRTSYGQDFTEDFQRRYATLVIELEFLNKHLERYLASVQKYCHEIAPEQSSIAMLTPSYLRDKSNGEARALVDNYFHQPDKEPIRNKFLIELVTDLVALMIQVKSLSDSDQNAHELTVLKQSMAHIKRRISPGNQLVFQNSVEIHMQYMESGLGQHGTLAPFFQQTRPPTK
ncbi:lin-9, putative [Pediculus humanus corporis]|uniref:Lin-9, putative n=1 Tax=Pediculus humanus subsp. corporis TaxID=121224 RepID=E0W435_PEDHC|nr:lin-9, putative [Pediculus humanus corporis]EEB20391.1 lin-9, putative [Pediculus humanus corporis]